MTLKPNDHGGPYIFISYPHQIREQAEIVIQSLQSAGYRVWFDFGLVAGSSYNEVIAERIIECEVFCCLLSREYYDSQYCRQEFFFAKEELKKPIIPIFVGEIADVKASLPAGIRLWIAGIHAITLGEKGKFLKQIEDSGLVSGCCRPKGEIISREQENKKEVITSRRRFKGFMRRLTEQEDMKEKLESEHAAFVRYIESGDKAYNLMKLEKAKMYYQKRIVVILGLVEKTGAVEYRRDLAVCYDKLGDTAKLQPSGADHLDHTVKYQHSLEEAKDYFTKCLRIRSALAEETGTAEARRDLSISYYKCGEIAEKQYNWELARSYYEKCLEIRLTLTEEVETFQAFEDLQSIYCYLRGFFLSQVLETHDESIPIEESSKGIYQKAIQVLEDCDYPQLKAQAVEAKRLISRVITPEAIPGSQNK